MGLKPADGASKSLSIKKPFLTRRGFFMGDVQITQCIIAFDKFA